MHSQCSPGHADAAGCNLALLGLLRPNSKDIRCSFAPSAKPETSWIINFFSHRGTTPDPPPPTSIALPFCRGSHVNTIIRCLEEERHPPDVGLSKWGLWLHLIFYKLLNTPLCPPCVSFKMSTRILSGNISPYKTIYVSDLTLHA